MMRIVLEKDGRQGYIDANQMSDIEGVMQTRALFVVIEQVFPRQSFVLISTALIAFKSLDWVSR